MKRLIGLLFASLIAAAILFTPSRDAVAAIFASREDVVEDITQLRNSDIRWSGSYVGLDASIDTERAKRLLHANSSTPYLIGALSDPSKFAAAHVILTYRWKGKIQGSAAQWNGLTVHLHGAEPSFDDSQRAELEQVWKGRVNRR